MSVKRCPIVLNSISYEDDYEGDFATRRQSYTLDLLGFYLYGPVTGQSVIKTVQVDQFTDLPDKSPEESKNSWFCQTFSVLMILDLMKRVRSSKTISSSMYDRRKESM